MNNINGPKDNEYELPDFQEENEDEFQDEDEYRQDEVDENGIPFL